MLSTITESNTSATPPSFLSDQRQTSFLEILLLLIHHECLSRSSQEVTPSVEAVQDIINEQTKRLCADT